MQNSESSHCVTWIVLKNSMYHKNPDRKQLSQQLLEIDQHFQICKTFDLKLKPLKLSLSNNDIPVFISHLLSLQHISFVSQPTVQTSVTVVLSVSRLDFRV